MTSSRMFGDAHPVGQTFTAFLDGEARTFEVTGLMDDVPANSHLDFDLLVSNESLVSTTRCLRCGQQMYVRLAPGVNPDSIAARTLALLHGQGQDRVEDVKLEALHDIHFSPHYGAADERYVYLLTAVAVLILLIACANYVNLATARSLRRTREVGVRKAVGALRGQLTQQFLAETVLMALLALPLALGLLLMARPTFNTLAETEIALGGLGSVPFLGTLVGVVAFVGLVAGAYPALVLARLQPVVSLRGQMASSLRASWLRRVLVVFQFAASFVLLIGTAVVFQQLRYMQTQKLGFDTDQIVMVTVNDPQLVRQPDVVKQALGGVAGVTSVSGGSGPPGQAWFSGRLYTPNPEDGGGTFANPVIDADFLRTMNIPLLAGRNIREQLPDSFPYDAIINEAAVKAMGWASPEEALGKMLSRRHEVVGVVPDFHFESLHHPVAPLLMEPDISRRGLSRFTLRLAGGDIPATLGRLGHAWKALGTDTPFTFRFLDDTLNEQYGKEQRTARIFGTFAGLAVLLACLGLFGLAALTAVQRTKEIGIRKVLGASVTGIVAMLTKDVVGLVGVAFLVAAPIAFWAMRRWLEGFAFPIALSWTLFLVMGAVVLIVAVLTVSYQAIHAALHRPAESLRYE